MATRVIKVEECKEGDILAEDIFSNFGSILVSENSVLNDYIIYRLTEFGISHIRIYSTNKGNFISEENSILYLKENYEKSIMEIKSMINELAAGKPLNVEKIINITEAVSCGIHDSCNMLSVLNAERGFDEYTYTHSLNVAFYALLIAKWLKFDKECIRTAIKSGLLHDIGKTKIPIDILNKKGRLTDEEFGIIKKHPVYGYEIARETGCFADEVCEAILLHHERLDKSGYPFGIGADKTNVYAQIIAVADVYDAMTSDRVYRKRHTPFEVFKMFKTVGIQSFDPEIVNTFLTNLSAFYVGSKVLLSTGQIGEVVYIPPQSITEPVISIDSKYVDLANVRDKQILCIV